MRIVLHDYPGHAFPLQLSRALAARGHPVLHLHFDAFQSPKGPLAPRPDDPPGLAIQGLAVPGAFRKYDLVRRFLKERAYARLLTRAVEAFRPDVVLGGNGPLDPQAALQAWSRKHGIRFVFWLQDAYGIAIDRLLRAKLPVAGAVVGARYRALERQLWRRSDVLVAITEDFRPLLDQAAIDPARVVVVENWAALDELPQRPRQNPWAQRHGLADKRVILYSGTMGLKHNPELPVALARAFRARPDVRVVVVSEGIGADRIRAAVAAEGLDNLLQLPFQPYDQLPDVVATGDLLLVVLEKEAGIYSVPSKTLTYLCAGRAVLGAIPRANLAARLIERHGMGAVVEPDDAQALVAAAGRLLDDPEARGAMGRAARAYAESRFDIRDIADRFEAILAGPAASAPGASFSANRARRAGS